jgi:thiosulfate dehydrogenase [quinone] large subunit
LSSEHDDRDAGTLSQEEVNDSGKVAVMSVTNERSSSTGVQGGPTATGNSVTTTTARVLAALRIAFGFTFLWAFLDKLLALGFSTGHGQDGTLDRFGDAAWINGGSPTEGFLKFGADGPFKGFYQSIGGTVVADWLFMLGLLGIGLALTLGIGMRFAAAAGALLYVLMWTAVLPPENNPLVDDHILGALTLVALALLHAGDTWGLGHWWARQDIVEKSPVLK